MVNVFAGLTKSSSSLTSGTSKNLTVSASGTKITISAQRDVDKTDASRVKTESTPITQAGEFFLKQIFG